MSRSGAQVGVDGAADLVARLSWDVHGEPDVDLQAVIVDNRGRVIDAACYNNTKACSNRTVVHLSCKAGEEQVVAKLAEIPAAVHVIFFLVCKFRGGVLQDSTGAVSVEQQAAGADPRTLLSAQLASCCGPDLAAASGVLVAAVTRGEKLGRWRLRPLWDPLPEARHFMDCLPALGRHVAAEVQCASLTQCVAALLTKRGMVEFGLGQRCLALGLGCNTELTKVEFDVAALLLDDFGEVLEAVHDGHLRCSGSHSEEGAVALLDSGGRGGWDCGADRQVVTVRLDQLGEAVHDIYLHVSVYTKTLGVRKTIADIGSPYCRAMEGGPGGGAELCRYTYGRSSGDDVTGLLIARLRRSSGDRRWGLQALGSTCAGASFEDAIADARSLSQVAPRDLQMLPEADPSAATEAAPAGPWQHQGSETPCDCALA